jgi:histidinol-phosphate/aromatic aminotransferase/cobyric acid decarboxylase-like protein/SAM-dependent methyltransferase
MVEWAEGAGDRRRSVAIAEDAVCRLLADLTPGRRVVVVGCGTGREAIALARAGFTVTGLDPSQRVIDQASRAAAKAEVSVHWHRVDLRAASAWPLTAVDAAICPDWYMCGRDAHQQRLFTRIRRYLTDRGVLIVGSAPPRGHVARDTPAPVSGGNEATHVDHLNELVRVIRAAGYAVESGNITSRAGTSHLATHVVARALPVPPRSLAVTAWGEPADNVLLDLRYADDEAEWLDPQPAEVWTQMMASASQGGADVVGQYPVSDPFGGLRGAPVVSWHFGCPIAAHQLTFGAGVTSLLHGLAGLADDGPILAPALVHPDLEAWAAARGAEVRLVEEPATCQPLLKALDTVQPTLLHVDRPAFAAGIYTLNEVAALARAASAVGAVVVVDESAALYLGPADSAIRLVGSVGNLVVLRGFTKAYSLGGLRCGFAVCTDGVADQVRELVAPMQVSELALQGALRLLAAGDILGRLRERIRTVKPAFAERLAGAGLDVTYGHPDIPWVVVADAVGSATRFLAERGIRALLPLTAPVLTPPRAGLIRLTVPLSARRIALFNDLMPTGSTHTGGPS